MKHTKHVTLTKPKITQLRTVEKAKAAPVQATEKKSGQRNDGRVQANWRMPPSLVQKLKNMAQKAGYTQNDLAITLLEGGLLSHSLKAG